MSKQDCYLFNIPANQDSSSECPLVNATISSVNHYSNSFINRVTHPTERHTKLMKRMTPRKAI